MPKNSFSYHKTGHEYDKTVRRNSFKELPEGEEDSEDYMIMESSRACTDTAKRSGYSYWDTCQCIDGNLGCDDCPWGIN
jgi:hypothetical protein